MVRLIEAGGASQNTSAMNDNIAANRLLLSKRELAAVLNVSERTIENWISEKRIPQLKLSSRLTRFSLAKVQAALSRYEVKEVGVRR